MAVPNPSTSAIPPRPAGRRSALWVFIVLAGAAVVLGFLFLFFASIFSKPQVMQVTMPERPGPTAPQVVSADALTIILGKNHQLYYYYGPNTPAHPPVLHPIIVGQPLRKVFTDWQKLYKSQVFIKPSAESGYQDMVNMLDEMSIVNQQQYALMHLSPADRELVLAAER